MNRSRVNLIVDALMFVVIMAAVGIGFLIEYVVIPGQQVPARYGADVELYLFGLDRHQWGQFHLIAGLLLLGLLIVHIVLHWNWVLSVYRKMVASAKKRRVVTPLFLLGNLLLVGWFLLASPELRSFERGGGRGRGVSSAALESGRSGPGAVVARQARDTAAARVQEVAAESDEENSLGINGRYTLGGISAKFHVPTPYLLQKLGLPGGTSPAAKLGRLRRVHGFKMSDVEKIIRQYRDTHQSS